MPARDLYPDRMLHLAIPRRVFEGIFAERVGQAVVTSEAMRVVVFDEKSERIIQWAP